MDFESLCFQKIIVDVSDYKTCLSESAITLPPVIEYISRSGVLLTVEDLRNLDNLRSKHKDSGKQFEITKEFVVKLERFRTRVNFEQQYTFDVLECCGLQCLWDKKKGRKVLSKVVKDYSNTIKSKSRSNGEEQFESFCRETFKFTSTPSYLETRK
jgi:hypothetical protein